MLSMIDYGKIGQRIAEQRKYIRKISQEKMAEELDMYQADVSNLEKAKKGSGITDLDKLDIIAEYFGIPIEKLLFGKGEENMVKYMGKKMEIKPYTKKLPRTHLKTLGKLIGHELKPDYKPLAFECGPYRIYIPMEYQCINPKGPNGEGAEFGIHKPHTYIFFENEVIGAMVATITSVMEHVCLPMMAELQKMIPGDILDITDMYRTINPYWALHHFATTEEDDKIYGEKMLKRMDEIRALGEDTTVLYIESVYVREDCRRKGIFRMFIDIMRKLTDDGIMWLNMEPTAGCELDNEYTCLPSYTVSDIGQVTLNGSIAERLGFTVDPDAWHRMAETVDSDGNVTTETVLIRKCAYYLPERFKKLIANDKDLVAIGRAKQKLQQTSNEDDDESEEVDGNTIIDIRDGKKDGFAVFEKKETVVSGPEKGKKIYVYAAHSIKDEEIYRFGVSYRSVFSHGLDHKNQLEQYEYLDDAVNSEYFTDLNMLNAMAANGVAILKSKEKNIGLKL